jgi:hypothetical protein
VTLPLGRPETLSRLSSPQLRLQIRIRLERGRLPSVPGVYRHHRGMSGESCAVCRRSVEGDEGAYSVGNPPLTLVAHRECYTLWREESLLERAPRIPGRP